MSARRIEVKLSNERLITPSGLTTVGDILNGSSLNTNVNAVSSGKRSAPYIPNSDIFRTYIGMLCRAKPAFEAVKEMVEGDDEFYKLALGIDKELPLEVCLRQRMDEMGKDMGAEMRTAILKTNISLFRNWNIEPTALANGYVPVDIDVTPMDNSKTKKEGVSRTYKGFDGYAPIMVYIGIEGYCICVELREGKQHCQKGTAYLLREVLKLCRQITNKPLLIRMDSGNDATENLGILLEANAGFIIKRNIRSECKNEWLDNAQKWCLPENIHYPREGKIVYIGSTWREVIYTNSKGKKVTKTMRMVYEIIERNIDKHGQISLEPQIEVNTYWTNTDLTDDEVNDLYHKHGESEQFHSEFKTDMDIERLPSGKFATNSLVLELAMIAYNILRIMGQVSLLSGTTPKTKHEVKRRRIRTVIDNLISIAGHVTTHCRKTVLALGRSNVWRHAFMNLYNRFAPIGCSSRCAFYSG